MAVLLASVGVAVGLAVWLVRDVLVDHGQVLRALANADDDVPPVPGAPGADGVVAEPPTA